VLRGVAANLRYSVPDEEDLEENDTELLAATVPKRRGDPTSDGTAGKDDDDEREGDFGESASAQDDYSEMELEQKRHEVMVFLLEQEMLFSN
jgi:hypothetical protein